MPEQHRACPQCRRDGRWLEEASREAMVHYYRCEHCGCVWNIRKADPTWTTIVTERGNPPES